ncbi:unnamed protein product, partial [marine sediment metagenome]
HVGAEMKVKVIGIDDQRRIRLSRKAVLQDEGGSGEDSKSGQQKGERERRRDRPARDRRPRSGGSSSR